MLAQSIWQAVLSDDERQALRPGLPDRWPRQPDLLVIGGGIVGLAIAYFVARRKLGQVLVVEQDALAGGASGANAGGIFPGQQRAHLPAVFRELGMASHRLYSELAEEPWARFDWRQNGSLAVSPERFSCAMLEYVLQERERGRKAWHVSGAALRKLEPALDPEIREAVYYPEDGHLNPVRAALSFARAGCDLGAIIATGVRVQGIDLSGDRIAQVRTTAGNFSPGTVILATGWAAPQLAAPLGLSLPVEPAKGQMIATEPLAWQLRTPITSTQAMLQLGSGQLIAGGTVEYVGEDCQPTRPILEQIAAEARRVLPALRGVKFVRAWAGLRPHTPDDMPVIDHVRGLENLIVAVGHFKNGVLLAPITGQLLADWIADGRPSMDLSTLRVDRFSDEGESQ